MISMIMSIIDVVDDPDVNFEPTEEASEAIKYLDDLVLASADVFGYLKAKSVKNRPYKGKIEDINQKENANASKYDFRRWKYLTNRY